MRWTAPSPESKAASAPSDWTCTASKTEGARLTAKGRLFLARAEKKSTLPVFSESVGRGAVLLIYVRIRPHFKASCPASVRGGVPLLDLLYFPTVHDLLVDFFQHLKRWSAVLHAANASDRVKNVKERPYFECHGEVVFTFQYKNEVVVHVNGGEDLNERASPSH